MSAFPAALSSHLAGEVTTLCHCWRLTRGDATVFGFTDHDRALTAAGTMFNPDSGLAASEARDTLGLAVDTVDVEGALSSDLIRDDDIAAGLYDGATVETFLVNWRAPTDFALLRRATIGKITRSDGRFVAELESLAHGLDQPSGRYVMRNCDAELGDARCGVNLDGGAFSADGVVVATELGTTIVASGLGAIEPGFFSHGTLRWTSGERDGRGERIEDHRHGPAGTRLVLRPGRMPSAGDAFTAFAGCDKRFSTCKAKFSNQVNFRGYPHLPGNDAAYAYVVDGDKFDGGPVVP